MNNEILFDDTYTGPRWTYGLKYRPLFVGNVPPGWIVGSHREHPDYQHGTVQYPFRLEDAVASAYELDLIEEE